MASIAVDDGGMDLVEELIDHDSLESLRDAIESLLDDMATESVHAQANGVVADMSSKGNDLIIVAILKATLDKEVAKAIAHQLKTASRDGLHDVVLHIWRTKLELLLEEDRSLLIVLGDNAIDDDIPVASDVLLKELTKVELSVRVNVDVVARLTELRWIPRSSGVVAELGRSWRKAGADGSIRIDSGWTKARRVSTVEVVTTKWRKKAARRLGLESGGHAVALLVAVHRVTLTIHLRIERGSRVTVGQAGWKDGWSIV